jgi:CDP-diacylglycerol---serine O-phosphatidyltransferase
MVFDGLDGRIARWTGTESVFGKEYDSLADMVAFGLAPAIVAYQWGVERIAEYGDAWGRFGWIATFFYAVCAALRLARFNARSAAPTNATSRACRARRPPRCSPGSSGC